MKFIYLYLTAYLLLFPLQDFAQAQKGELNITFEDGDYNPSQLEETEIEKVIRETAGELRGLFSSLPDVINVTVQFVSRDLSIVDGAAGRADRHSPEGEVVVVISTSYDGGVLAATRDGVPTVIYHEFHHMARGWTIQNSHEHDRIISAVVSEGLAVVFAEKQTGREQIGNQYPEEVAEWIPEIMALPDGANYSHWVSGENPDGRKYIGYRAGKYLIEQALKNSGLSILELSELSEEKILKAAGF